jgi:membrane protease subunit HflK
MRFEMTLTLLVLGIGPIISFALYQAFSKKWSLAEKRAYFSTNLMLGLTVILGTMGLMWAKSYVVYAAILPLALGFFCSGIAYWRAFLIRREEEESEERTTLLQDSARLDLFDDTEDAMSAASIARKQFDKWGISFFTLLMGGGLLLASWMTLQSFRRLLEPNAAEVLKKTLEARGSMEALGFSLCFMIVTLLLGVYWNGASREKDSRFMRPVGQWLIFSGIVFGAASVLMVVEFIGGRMEDVGSLKHWDLHVSIWLLYLYMAFGAQMLFNFVMEFYRPRSGEDRPLYESRILAIVTDPGNVATNISKTLEYQFGVKVSESWIHNIVVWKVAPFIVALVVCLYLLDCFAFVRHNEMGVVTKCGAFEEVIQPGFHIKWPRPFTRIIRYPVKQVRRVTIGFEEFGSKEEMQSGMEDPGMQESMGDPTGRVIVWSKQHFKHESHYLLPARVSDESPNDEPIREPVSKDVKSAPAIDFLSASMAVYYKIQEDEKGEGLKNYYLNYRNPERVLKALIKKEVITFFSTADLMNLITTGNKKAQETLFERLRNRVNSQTKSLGIDVVNFVMIGLHPPVPVAESYQSIVTARQEVKKVEHEEWSERYMRVEGAKGKVSELVEQAKAYKFEKTNLPQTEVEQFKAKLLSFQQAPEVFKMRFYLDALEDISKSEEIWKYLIATNRVKLISEFTHKEPTPSLETVDPNRKED